MAQYRDQYDFGAFIGDYGGHEVIMPVVLVLSFLASAVHLAVIDPIQPAVYADQIPALNADNALLVFLGALAVTYATSETRAWEHYRAPEKLTVIFVGVGMLLRQFSTVFQDWFQGFGDAGLLAMFGLVVLVTIIIAR